MAVLDPVPDVPVHVVKTKPVRLSYLVPICLTRYVFTKPEKPYPQLCYE